MKEFTVMGLSNYKRGYVKDIIIEKVKDHLKELGYVISGEMVFIEPHSNVNYVNCFYDGKATLTNCNNWPADKHCKNISLEEFFAMDKEDAETTKSTKYYLYLGNYTYREMRVLIEKLLDDLIIVNNKVSERDLQRNTRKYFVYDTAYNSVSLMDKLDRENADYEGINYDAMFNLLKNEEDILI